MSRPEPPLPLLGGEGAYVGSLSPRGEGGPPLADRVRGHLRLPALPILASSSIRTALVLTALGALVLLAFRDAIGARLVAFEQDTWRFYYPLESWAAAELKAGRFPLWNPHIFAGYPIFADGELGLANPIHLFLLSILPPEQAYVWQRVSSAFIAALSLFLLCRALGLSLVASLLGGLAFSLGSFVAAQQHHDNMTRTVAWAPMALACVEWAFQRSGRGRLLFLTGAAMALGMASLGLHPQGLAMTGLTLASYIAFRGIVQTPSPIPLPLREGEGRLEIPSPPSGERPVREADRVRGRLTLTAWTGLYVFALGIGLGAVQLLPTAEMGFATYRASQPEYSFATSYALPPQNLLTLVFPYFFRGPDASYWSLWAQWETTVYLGIVPLALGIFGALLGRAPHRFFFLGLGVVGLWLAFASYAPVDLYRLLWQLPGFSALRVPGRYSFLFVLGWSVLAAYGLAALQERSGRLSRRRAVMTAAIAVSAAGAVLVLALGMGALRAGLLPDEQGALGWISSSYLSLPRFQESLPPETVYRGLLHSLDPGTPRTAVGLGLLAATPVLLAGILLRWPGRALWTLAIVGTAAADLLAFGTALHPKISLDELATPTPGIEFLTSHTGPWRVLALLPDPSREPTLHPNRLAAFGVDELGGYSSLESRRHFNYWAQLTGSHNQLLELANVRYLIGQARLGVLPSFQGVSFDPDRPLLIGRRGSVGGAETYLFNGERAHSVRVVGALTHAWTVPQNALVAEITLVPKSGSPVTVPLRAGIDLAEWAYDRSDAVGKIQHAKPDRIIFRRPDRELISGAPSFLYLFYSQHDLPSPLEVARVDIRYVHPEGAMELYGLALHNRQTGESVPLMQRMRSKFQSVYRDQQVEIIENTAAFPRAYVVRGARGAAAGLEGVGTILYTPFDPAREVLLEGDEAELWVQVTSPTVPSSSPLVPSELVVQEPSRVVYRANAPEGGFFVHVASWASGWRAWVDGEEAPVLRANYLFQAVPLGPGSHSVELRYEAAPVRVGLALTIVALLATFGVIGAAWRARRRAGR